MGIANLEEIKRRKEDAEGLNPCFTGDMKLLTVDGYKSFKELSGGEVELINKDGFTSKGKVWSNGTKEIVKIIFEGEKDPIKCTPDHVFMLVNGEECEAKNLVGKELLPYKTASMKIPKVKAVESAGEAKVYDFNEPLTNWGIVNGVTVHNCAEILLQDRQHCNLTAINMMEFLDDAGGILYDDLERAQELATYVAFIISMQELDLLEWEKVAREDRIIGVSMTGYQDFLNKGDISDNEKVEILKFIRRVAHSHNEELANRYNTTKAELVTSAQPAGCFTEDHTRTLDQGIYFIDELNTNIDDEEGFVDIDENYSMFENKVGKTYKNNIQDILRVTLKNGRELKVTKEHPMSVGSKWRKAKDLEIGDQLDYELGIYKNTREAKLDVDVEASPQAFNYKLPEVMSEDLAWLMGSYFANGCFTTRHRIKYISNHIEVHKKVQRLWKELFDVETEIKKDPSREAYIQNFASSEIREWINVNGFNKYADNEPFNRIPLKIRESSWKSVLGFIVGYADNDGYFGRNTIRISSANSEFMRHLQEVGEAVGVSFSFSINSARENSFSQKNMYECRASRAFSTKEAFDYINKKSVKAQYQDKVEIGLVRSKNPYMVTNIETIEEQETYDIEVENIHYYFQGGLKSHNTVSILPDSVSSGVHWSHSPYYIRRVRVSSSDPVAKSMVESGFDWYPEVGQTKEDHKTKVFEFPIKAPEGKTKYDVSAIEQLEEYKDLMEHYVDHNASITVHVRKDEWDKVEQWLWNNWDDFVGISFLPLDDSFYELLPYEAIDEDKYYEMKENIPEFDPEKLTNYEDGSEFEIDEGASCSSGSCPVR